MMTIMAKVVTMCARARRGEDEGCDELKIITDLQVIDATHVGCFLDPMGPHKVVAKGPWTLGQFPTPRKMTRVFNTLGAVRPADSLLVVKDTEPALRHEQWHYVAEVERKRELWSERKIPQSEATC